jgi:hypothetical protein
LKYTRLRNDSDGHARFFDEEPDFEPIETAPGAPPIGIAAIGSSGVSLGRLPAGWEADYHPTPQVEWWVQTAGEVEVTPKGGEPRVLRPGDVYCFENTIGEGHRIRVLGDIDVLGVFFLPQR